MHTSHDTYIHSESNLQSLRLSRLHIKNHDHKKPCSRITTKTGIETVPPDNHKTGTESSRITTKTGTESSRITTKTGIETVLPDNYKNRDRNRAPG
jgi:hypothetical protein